MDRAVLCDGFNVSVGSCTHIGMGRAANEDTIFKMSTDKIAKASTMGCLWAVADGMGGHDGGKIASSIACDALQTYYDQPLLSIQNNQNVKEWLADTSSQDEKRVISRVMQWSLGGQAELPLKRHPWEGFVDVGFRTIVGN